MLRAQYEPSAQSRLSRSSAGPAVARCRRGSPRGCRCEQRQCFGAV